MDQVTSGKYMVNVSYITSDINDDDELATLQGDYKAPGEFHSFMSWYQSDTVSDLLKKARETTDLQNGPNTTSRSRKPPITATAYP